MVPLLNPSLRTARAPAQRAHSLCEKYFFTGEAGKKMI